MERKKIWSDVIFRCAMSMLSGFSAVITVAICLKIDFMAVVVKDNSAIFLIIGYINAKILYGAVKKGHIKASEIGDDFFNLKSKTLFYEPFFFSIPLIIFLWHIQGARGSIASGSCLAIGFLAGQIISCLRQRAAVAIK